MPPLLTIALAWLPASLLTAFVMARLCKLNSTPTNGQTQASGRGTPCRAIPTSSAGIFFDPQPLDHSSHEKSYGQRDEVAGLHGAGGTL